MTESSKPEHGGDAPRDVRRPYVEAKLFAAFSHLIEEGAVPADISVGRLSREAGISRATFYLYFDDRAAFNLRLVEHGWELVADPIQKLWQSAVAGSHDAEAALFDLLRTYREQRAVMAAVMGAGATDSSVESLIQSRLGTLIDATAEAIERGQQSGEIRGEIPSWETAAILVWMTERACAQIGRDADDAGLRRLASAMAEVSRSGVATRR